jgi:hypothetical protein
MHPEVVTHSAEAFTRSHTGDVASVKAFFDSHPIVASTCLGIGHPAVAGRRFDYCIFDEAGQSLLLATLGPLFHADKFVLFGDTKQLPPVVQSTEARCLSFFFFFYGPPRVPRCRRSLGKVRPLRWPPDHQSKVEDSSFFLECRCWVPGF